MATAIGIVSTKEFSYRSDNSERFSNKYWFTGAVPTSAATWKTFYDTLVAAERTVMGPLVHFVAATGYDNDTPGSHSVWSWERTTEPLVSGSLIIGATDTRFAGDQAAMLEWKLARKNSRGKWVYLRKYFHGGAVENVAPDDISPAMLTAMQNVGVVLSDGTWNQGHQLRSQKGAETITGVIASPYVTTRTLKRRGKRP